jgi:hypothetical protein
MARCRSADLAGHPGRKVIRKEVFMESAVLAMALLVAMLVIDRLAR